MRDNLVTTSFEIDYHELATLQRHGERLGFRSWGAFVRHVLDLHVVEHAPDILAKLKAEESGKQKRR